VVDPKEPENQSDVGLRLVQLLGVQAVEQACHRTQLEAHLHQISLNAKTLEALGEDIDGKDVGFCALQCFNYWS